MIRTPTLEVSERTKAVIESIRDFNEDDDTAIWKALIYYIAKSQAKAALRAKEKVQVYA